MGRLVFISYRREAGYELAHLVDAELRSRGLRTFIDVSESDAGRFWPQIRAAIDSCSAFVLICTNGTFAARSGDDWVLREVSEAAALGRSIVPVFSQQFTRPTVLTPLIAQAIECNGVTMDTQFHVAAFDHLSQLVGGRKRSEQRRRTAATAALIVLSLLAALGLGGREIIRLSGDLSVERTARQAADERSEKLAKSVAVLEKTEKDIRQATEESDRLAKAQADGLRALQSIETANRHAAEERDRLTRLQADQRERDRIAAEKQAAISRANQEKSQLWARARDDLSACKDRCYKRFESYDARQQCNEDCKDTFQRVCPWCPS